MAALLLLAAGCFSGGGWDAATKRECVVCLGAKTVRTHYEKRTLPCPGCDGTGRIGYDPMSREAAEEAEREFYIETGREEFNRMTPERRMEVLKTDDPEAYEAHRRAGTLPGPR